MADNFQQPFWFMQSNGQWQNPPQGQEGSASDISNPGRYKDVSIPQEDLNRIISLFGDNIANIYELNAGENHMLSEVVYDSRPPMLLQYVEVINTDFPLDKAKIKRNFDALLENRENLRAAFVYNGVSKPYKVIRKYCPADVTFSSMDLEKNAPKDEIDRWTHKLVSVHLNRSFNIELDCLLRITIASSKDEKQHIVIVSQPHINTDGISIGLLAKTINELLVVDYEKIGTVQDHTSEYETYAKYLNENTDKESELKYWESLMYGFEELPVLPGRIPNITSYSAKTYSSMIPKSVFGKINRLQGTLHTTVFSILQSIWAINLSQLSRKNDQCFGAVISGRDSQATGSYSIVGGFASVIPVRVKVNEKATVAQLIAGVSEQSVESMNRNHCSVHEICEKIGRKERLFNHSLDYLSFLEPEPGGVVSDNSGLQIVSRNVMINCSDDLGVVIAKTAEGLSILANYNQLIFNPQAVKLFIGNYLNLVSYIADNGPDVVIADLPKPSEKEFEGVESRKRNIAKISKNLLGNYKFFLDVPDEKVDEIYKNMEVLIFGEGEQISANGAYNNSIMFVINGSAELFIKNKKGELKKYGHSVVSGILNLAALYGKPAAFSAISKEDNTIVVAIDVKTFWKVLWESPLFCKSFFSRIYSVTEEMIHALVD